MTPLLIWLLLIASAAAPAQTQSPSEYEVKAIFLYRFAKFIEWPEPSSPGPICIGILGHDPFGDTLDEVVKGKSVNGRPFAIKRFSPGQQARDCHILFISSSEGKRLRSVLNELQGGGVLTVSETRGFCQTGGVINFELVDDSVRLEINVDAAERAGLRMSSRLLGVARIVRDAAR
jgi:hypothetical protein